MTFPERPSSRISTDLLDDPEIELVVVAAPNAAHHELARAALLAGRHVVVDKPFTLTSAQADDLIDVAAREDRRLTVFHQRRWDADYRTVRHCVQAGVLGRLGTYVARYDRFRPTVDARDRPIPGAGVLYDLGPHLIDQALHLFGLPDDVLADVTAQRPGSGADDYVHLVLRYGPLRVVLHAGSLVREPGPRFEVHGDAASLVTRGRDGQVAALLAGRRPGDPGWGAADDLVFTLEHGGGRARPDRGARRHAGCLRDVLPRHGGGGARCRCRSGHRRGLPRHDPGHRAGAAEQRAGTGGSRPLIVGSLHPPSCSR